MLMVVWNSSPLEGPMVLRRYAVAVNKHLLALEEHEIDSHELCLPLNFIGKFFQ